MRVWLRDGPGREALEPLPDGVEFGLTPHLAGDSLAAERRVYRLVREQIERYMRGEPLVNVVKADS